MKTTLIIISAALVITMSACNQKEKLVEKTATESKDVIQKVQETAPQVTHETTKKVNGTVKAVEDGTKKPAPAANVTTEQALTETVDHAQAVTKTQKSESRQRGQKAEDEMMMEIEKRK